MLRLLPWGHLNLSEINSIAVANSRMGAAPKSPSHPPHHLRRPVRPQPQHPEQQRYHRPQQGEGDARAGHNEMRPGRRTLLHVRLSGRLARIFGCGRLCEPLGHENTEIVGVRPPVAGAYLGVASGAIHLDQVQRRLSDMQCHDLATQSVSGVDCVVVNELAVPLAFVRRRYCELPERPSAGLAEKQHF